MKKIDTAKTVLVTPDGRYEFMRMPFGMKNSGTTLVRGMRKILKDMDNVESCSNDLLIFTDSREAHVKTVEKLLSKLQRANLTAKPSKCVFEATSVEFLGHNEGFDWIMPKDDNLEKVAGTKRPTNKKEVRSFFGLMIY